MFQKCGQQYVQTRHTFLYQMQDCLSCFETHLVIIYAVPCRIPMTMTGIFQPLVGNGARFLRKNHVLFLFLESVYFMSILWFWKHLLVDISNFTPKIENIAIFSLFVIYFEKKDFLSKISWKGDKNTHSSSIFSHGEVFLNFLCQK